VRRADRAGASLLELVMVILLIGVGMVPVLAVFREAASRSPVSEMQTRAALLAAEQLEAILRDRADAARGYAWITAANYPAEGAIAGFPGFTRTTTVSADTTIGGVSVRRVSVSVSHALVPAVVLRTWFTGVAP